VSYAWEDGALAEWLTLKLTAEGYRVWCDRFKILGGERWPDDIDAAIRDDTFRMLHLVSKFSLHKPNPKKERELALQLEGERGEILIPLNVDGTKPTELPWRIVDVAYIPFQDWGAGLNQLLKKLNSINAPRPLGNTGREIAGSAFLIRSPVTERDENLFSNIFPFTSIPKVIRSFRFSQELTWRELSDLHAKWAFHNKGGRDTVAFTPPPASLRNIFPIEEVAKKEWQEGSMIEGILAEHLVMELLSKSLEVHCRKRGLVGDPSRRGFYFPMGLLRRNTISFESYLGKRSWVLACGYRTFRGGKYRYHLCPWFHLRHELGSHFVAQLRIRVHLTDLRGVALEERSAVARRKNIGSAWWNAQWLSRQFAVMSFLMEGETEIKIGEDPESQVILDTRPIGGSLNRGIDEDLLTSMGAPLGLLMPGEDEKQEEEE
jgi:hypothetical protein